MKLEKLMIGLFLLWIFMGIVNADGIIIPDPIPRIPYPELAIKYHHVNITINNQYAVTGIDQVFENSYSRDLEGTYIFPLPEEASISKFSMWVDNEELVGEILEKEKARKIYEDIVRRAKDPALLEYFDRGMFKARVYPIPARGEKRISLSYSEMIRCEFGVCKYRYPLEIEKFSSKPLESIVILVKIKSKTPIKTIYSPTHEIAVNKISDYEAEVSYEVENVKPERDFELYYTLSEEDFGLNLLTFKKEEDGFFMLFLAPKQESGRGEILGKDIVFVLDTSGSMAGKKINQAKDALKFCINNLNEDDRFNVITFESNIEKFSEELVEVKEGNLEEARNFIEKFSASGGTNIQDALIDALKLFNENSNPKMIVFLTDGKPTVGVTNIEKILEDVSEENRGEVRIFVFGVGYDINTHLLDKLSLQNKGVSEYVKPDEDIEVKVSNFYAKISNPVLSDLKIDFGKIKVKDIYPKELPDLFKGSQLMLFGRYSNTGKTKIKLSGKIGDGEKEYNYDATFPEENLKNEFIPRLWASRKIGFLLDEIRLHGEEDELVDEIINLSLTYGIITAYTSFLVDIDTDLGSPVEPAAVREGFYESLTKNLFQAITGGAAVRSAKVTKDLKDTTQQGAEAKGIKTVGTKTFYLREETWVDNDYSKDFPTNKIRYDSETYFNLLSQNPEFGKYLALGKKVKFCFGDRCYEIGEIGTSTTLTTHPQVTTTIPSQGTNTTLPSIPPQSEALIFTLFVVGIIILISIGAIVAGRR